MNRKRKATNCSSTDGLVDSAVQTDLSSDDLCFYNSFNIMRNSPGDRYYIMNNIHSDYIVNRGAKRWSQEETDLLEKLVKMHGKKWAIISSSLPGRSEASCHHHWYGVVKIRQEGSKYIKNEFLTNSNEPSSLKESLVPVPAVLLNQFMLHNGLSEDSVSTSYPNKLSTNKSSTASCSPESNETTLSMLHTANPVSPDPADNSSSVAKLAAVACVDHDDGCATASDGNIAMHNGFDEVPGPNLCLYSTNTAQGDTHIGTAENNTVTNTAPVKARKLNKSETSVSSSSWTEAEECALQMAVKNCKGPKKVCK